MDFLSHRISLLSDRRVNVAQVGAGAFATALRRAVKALRRHACSKSVNRLDAFDRSAPSLCSALAMANSATLLDDLRALFRAEGQDVERLLDRFAAN